MIKISRSQFVEGDAGISMIGAFFMRFENSTEIKNTFTPSKKNTKIKKFNF
jgi:hypothetical protein